MTEVFLTWNHFIKQHPKKKSHLSTWPPISSGKAARGSGLPLGSLCGWPASQSPPTLCHPMVYSPPGSSVLGIFYQILIFAWKFKWYHWQQIILVIFLEATSLNCLIFKKMTKWLPDAQVWGSIIWLPVFQIKKKKILWRSNWFSLQPQHPTRAFAQDNPILHSDPAETADVYFRCHHTKHF